jgi:hypothetical protein
MLTILRQFYFTEPVMYMFLKIELFWLNILLFDSVTLSLTLIYSLPVDQY